MDDTYPRQTIDEKNQTPKAEAIKVGMDLQQWNNRTEELMEQGARIIASEAQEQLTALKPMRQKMQPICCVSTSNK